MVRVTIDDADVPVLREQIARWMPTITEYPDGCVKAAIESVLAEGALQKHSSLRFGVEQARLGIRCSLREQGQIVPA